jgi:hypothetical protein
LNKGLTLKSRLGPFLVILILVGMDEDGHSPVLGLDVLYRGIQVNLEHFKGVEVEVGRAGTEETLNLLLRGQDRVPFLNLLDLRKGKTGKLGKVREPIYF